MAHQDSNNNDTFNLNEVVTIRGDKYAFGTMNLGGGPNDLMFMIFRVGADFSLTPVTADEGVRLDACMVDDVKTLAEFIQRVRDQFMVRLNLWLKKKYPAGGVAPPVGTTPPPTGLVAMGNQVATMIQITDGPAGVVATL